MATRKANPESTESSETQSQKEPLQIQLASQSVRTLPGGRPIEVSHLQVSESLTLPGNRPIFKSHLQIVTTDLLPGHRPVFASNLAQFQMGLLPGNRPIGPNTIEDDEELMTFL